MLDLMQNFAFLRPWMLLLLIPAILFAAFFKPNLIGDCSWKKVCEAKFLDYLLIKNDHKTQKNGRFLIYAALISAVFALSGPSFKKIEQPILFGQNPIMILLDLSEDMEKTDVRPSRLSRAKIEIIDVLKQSKAAPSGLIVYRGEPFIISPLSEDENIIVNLLKAVSTDIRPLSGNRPDRAIDLALERFKQSGFSSGHIVIFSSNAPQKYESDAILSAKRALKDGFKVSVCDFSPVSSNTLKQIAKAGGGIYLNVLQNTDSALINFISSFQKSDLKESQNSRQVLQDNGWIFVFVTAFLTLLLFERGILVVLLTFFISTQANAGFLFNPDQEAMLAFSSKEYQTAAEKFKNEKWKASAAYKAGDYQKAVELFSKFSDVESVYNKGNALAKSGNIDEAIKTYETVLKQDSNHEDAKFNLEYLKKLKQSQKNQQNQKNQDQQQEQNQNQKETSQDQENQDNQQDQAASSQKQENQNEDKQKNNQPDQNNQSVGDENENQPQDEADAQNQNEDHNRENKQSLEKQKAQVMNAKEAKSDNYDEAVWAREQKFREIKEDTGGLLKAFIEQEYLKKRYED